MSNQITKLLIFSLLFVRLGIAQTSAPAEDTSKPEPPASVKRLVPNLLRDQKTIWTAPARVRVSDLNWMAPIGILTGSMIASDRYVPDQLSISANSQKRANSFSNYGVAGLAGIGGLLYLSGRYSHDDYKASTGVLTGEAMIDALAVAEVSKFVFRRERPLEGTGQGKFFHGGASFPSGHAMLAWSAASVLANRYPGPLTKFFVYGGAAAISTSRVFAYKHFPSDVMIGSTLGYLIGKKVSEIHSESAHADARYGTFVRSPYVWTGSNVGSPYVPLDSWVYAAIDRLQMLGDLPPVIEADRPWSRAACAKIVASAAADSSLAPDPEKDRLISMLQKEFASELNGEVPLHGSVNSIEISSVYSRTIHISGDPQTDGFHFAQSIVNDYGRPYGTGWNNVTGATAQGHFGPISFFVQGEFQRSGSLPALSLATRQVISDADFGLPLSSGLAKPAFSRGRLLDAYVGYTFHNLTFTFGRQSLWWGPGKSGGLLLTNNAEPINMARISTPEPFRLPLLGKLLGPGRIEFFVGQLDGYQYVTVNGQLLDGMHPRPMINGLRVSFKPTQNFEIGMGRTTLFAGPGSEFTPKSLFRSIFSTGNAITPGGSVLDPGDRRASFDMTYKLPGLRNWAQVYLDSFVDDEVSPIPYPHRTAFAPGIYLPKLPKINRLDFRLEGAYTDPPPLKEVGFFYDNIHYRSGYTNLGKLLGYWIGRDSVGITGTSNYWFESGAKLTASYRDQRVDHNFAMGGRLQSGEIQYERPIARNVKLEGGVQYERWRFPAIASGPQSDTAVTFGFTYEPKFDLLHRR